MLLSGFDGERRAGAGGVDPLLGRRVVHASKFKWGFWWHISYNLRTLIVWKFLCLLVLKHTVDCLGATPFRTGYKFALVLRPRSPYAALTVDRRSPLFGLRSAVRRTFQPSTEPRKSLGTWLREISSFSCLTFLPGPAWVLLSKICKDFFSALYNPRNLDFEDRFGFWGILCNYRGVNKGLYFLLSRTQAEQLSKSRKKFLATTYKPLFTSLY